MKKNLSLALFLVCALVAAAFIPSTPAFANVFDPRVIPLTDSPTTTNVSAIGTLVQPLAAIPSLGQFAANLNSGKSDVVAGVYVPEVFALRAVAQLANNPAYVSPINGTVTRFGLAAQSGTIGLLAHNYLSGAHFAKLSLGQEVDIVHGDGSVHRYIITSIHRFQALNPSSPYSAFVDLDNGGAQLSSTDLFNRIYAGGNKVVFQTCINANGSMSWGRLFVTATPM